MAPNGMAGDHRGRASGSRPGNEGRHEMVAREPATELCAPFSSPGAEAVPWGKALQVLSTAEVFWLSTVRPESRPHVTPLLGAWVDDSICFCTGEAERKAKNLAANSACTLTTGRNDLNGLDVVIEGRAVATRDELELQSIAVAFEQKYRSHILSPEGTWGGLGEHIRGGSVLVYRVIPSTAFGFKKGGAYSQTRWTFVP